VSIQIESWEKAAPVDLLPAMNHLRDSFDLAHFNFGWPTTQLCYWRLHDGTPRLGTRDIQPYVDTLQALKARVGPEATQRFVKLLSKETPPAIFKAFYDLYMDGLKLQLNLIFSGLLQIGLANRSRILPDPVEWARSLSEDLVNYCRHRIPLWIRNVCDEQPWDPNEATEEQIFWRKSQAPSFLIMEPSRFGVYDPECAWERNDQETSARWLDAFRDDYVLILGIELKNAAGMAALKQAMTPIIEEKPKEPQVNQTFNVNGPNARVNIDSTDNSTNIVNQGIPFSELRKAIESGVADGVERATILEKLADLEMATDRESGSKRYQSFIASAHHHMALLGPYLPALGHWVHTLVAAAT
jgi:hypothetical protein